MATRPKAVIESRNGEKLSPITIAKNVLTDDGQNLHDILSNRKEDMMTPTIENSSSMFKVGQGDNVDYSSNVVNGAYESMVLKGKTMVNIHKPSTPILGAAEQGWYENLTRASGEISFDVLSTPAGWRYINAGKLNYQMLKPNTKYLVVFESSQNISSIHFMRGDGLHGLAPSTVPVQNSKAIITTNSQIVVNEQILYVNFYAEPNTKVSFKNPMIIEYVKEMENWDIPYFEGMTSCKSPILSNVGANIFDFKAYQPYKASYANGYPYQTGDSIINYIKELENGFVFTTPTNTNHQGACYYVKVKRKTDYHISCDVAFTGTYSIKIFGIYTNEIPLTTAIKDNHRHLLNRDNLSTNTFQGEFNTKDFDCLLVYLGGAWEQTVTGAKTITFTNIQIKELQTPYEPYKSNTTTFDQKGGKTIVLRSLPNGVCDTLNVETGEYTQRIGEYTYNGDNDVKQHYVSNNNHGQPFFTIEVSSLGRKEAIDGISDTLPHESIYSAVKQTKNAFCVSLGGNTAIRFYVDGLTTTEQYRNYFRNVPITIQYELATPIVSTIDVQGFPYAYTNGHVQLSSGHSGQSLTPKVEYSVTTNRNGQIRSNQKMVERHQKQLDRLQAMILTNLVNTQYEQTLTNLKYDLKNVREEVK